MNRVKNYLSLIKFSHTIFAMPFALLGFMMGVYFLQDKTSSNPSSGISVLTTYFKSNANIFIYILGCMVFARSADRDFDAKNPRTAIREIPRGLISARSALRFTAFNSILFVGFAYMINTTCFLLSPIALIVILGYSYTKRFTPLCHIILGIGLSLAPAGAFIAVTETIHPAIVFLSLAVVGWVAGFDIIYSLQDDEFDSSQGLWSIPSALGRKKALTFSRLLHVSTVIFIILAGFSYGFDFLFSIGAVIFTSLLMYQQSIVKHDDLSRVNIAFMTSNGIGSIVFAAFAIADIILFKI